MKKRSNLEIMAKLIGMVRPLLGYMLLAITLGLIGHLLASFITIFAGYAALKVWGFPIAHSFAFFFGIGGICDRGRHRTGHCFQNEWRSGIGVPQSVR